MSVSKQGLRLFVSLQVLSGACISISVSFSVTVRKGFRFSAELLAYVFIRSSYTVAPPPSSDTDANLYFTETRLFTGKPEEEFGSRRSLRKDSRTSLSVVCA